MSITFPLYPILPRSLLPKRRAFSSLVISLTGPGNVPQKLEWHVAAGVDFRLTLLFSACNSA
jgi:hypothetical protein